MGVLMFMFGVCTFIYYFIIICAFVGCGIDKNSIPNVNTKLDFLICLLPYGFMFVQIKSVFDGLD